MIYFIQDGSTGLVKIGHTCGEAMERLKALQTGSPGQLNLLACIEGGAEREKEIHAALSSCRERGEWFRPGVELMRFLIEVATFQAQQQQERPRLRKGNPITFYLAGKISKNCWRHEVVIGLRAGQANSCPTGMGGEVVLPEWPIMERAVLGTHHYSGPYFFSCDHGCWHGEDEHGVGAKRFRRSNHGMQRQDVVSYCLQAIDRSDIVFAWIDRPDCYGTLFELGYARAKGIPVWIAGPQLYRDLWFSARAADRLLMGLDSPHWALRRLIEESP